MLVYDNNKVKNMTKPHLLEQDKRNKHKERKRNQEKTCDG